MKTVLKENKKLAAERMRQRYATAAQFSLPTSGWPKYKRDSLNSSYTNECLDLPLELTWKRSLAGHSDWISPIVDEKYVYVCMNRPASQYTVHVLDRKTGEIVGNIHTSEGVNTTPVVSNRYLYILWGERIISAFQKDIWKEIWTSYLPGKHPEASITLADGILICTNRHGYISAIDASNGTEIWKEQIFSVTGAPCIALGKVFYADGTSLIALNLQDGRESWRIKSEYGNFDYNGCAICSWQGKVFAYSVRESNLHKSSYTGRFCSYDVNNGQILWIYPIHKPYAYFHALNDDVILVGSDRLYALNIENGNELWTIPACFSPIIVGQNVITLLDSCMSVIDIRTGQFIQKGQPQDYEPLYAAPAYYDGFLYLLDSKANLYAYR